VQELTKYSSLSQHRYDKQNSVSLWNLAAVANNILEHCRLVVRCGYSVENWIPFLASPLGVNSDPQGRSCPPGVNFVPWGWSYPQGVKFSVHASILLNSRECSPLGVNEGVKIPPRGQISPLGARGEVKNGPQNLSEFVFFSVGLFKNNCLNVVIVKFGRRT
jgi:hypothetical protein